MNLINTGASPQQHIDTIIHHLFMLTSGHSDPLILNQLDTAVSSAKKLFNTCTVKGVKR